MQYNCHQIYFIFISAHILNAYNTFFFINLHISYPFMLSLYKLLLSYPNLEVNNFYLIIHKTYFYYLSSIYTVIIIYSLSYFYKLFLYIILYKIYTVHNYSLFLLLFTNYFFILSYPISKCSPLYLLFINFHPNCIQPPIFINSQNLNAHTTLYQIKIIQNIYLYFSYQI